MEKKTRNALVLLVVYLLIFWIGFKAGGIYVRMQRKVQVERVVVPDVPWFYIVEKHDRGSYSEVSFERADMSSPVMRIFVNEKLRPLLKLRDIKIYKETGEQVY